MLSLDPALHHTEPILPQNHLALPWSAGVEGQERAWDK